MTEAGVRPDASTARLQQVLVDLIALQLQGNQARWTAAGPGFLALHQKLGELVDDMRALGDRVAERIRELGGVPDGRAPTVVATAGLGPFPLGEQAASAVAELLGERLRVVAAAMRSAEDREDTATVSIVQRVVETVERYAWLIGSEAGHA